jgi:putative oxidoreductase
MRFVRLAGTIGGWALQVLLGALFILLGAGKFGDPSWERKFARWGYPDGFYMVVGVLEALGGLMLLVPRLTSYAAGMLGIIMIGASLTHVVHGESARVFPPLIYLALLATVGVARRHAAARPPSMRFGGGGTAHDVS